MSLFATNKKPTRGCHFTPIDIFGSPVEFNINGASSYKTVVGCFWTLVMAGLMIGATVYYFLQYLDSTNVALTSQVVQGTEYPEMDFKTKGLFVVLLFQKGSANFLRPNDVTRYFTVEAVQVTVNSTQNSSTKERVPSPPDNQKINFMPCRSINMTATVNGKKIQGKTDMAMSDFGLCSQLNNATDNSTFTLLGDEDADLFKYVQIRINPCNGTYNQANESDTTKTCALPNPYSASVPFGGQDDQKIRQSLRDYSMTVVIIDAALNATNFNDPQVFMMNGNYQFALTANQQKNIGFYFKTVEIQTDIGFISNTYDTKSSYAVNEVIFDSLDRGTQDRLEMMTPQGKQTRALPYITFSFLSSNTKLQYTRNYMKIVDVLGLVGGVSQVFTYAVIVLYAWYNSLRMEQELINRTVLHIDKDDDELEKWEKERKMSFWEIVKFHYFGMCVSKNPKYKLYKTCEDQLDDKTDITKIIRAVTDVQILKDAILTPAQAKLIRYTALNEVDAPEKHAGEDLTTFDAVQKIRNDRQGSNEISSRINKYILDNIPKDIGISKNKGNLDPFEGAIVADEQKAFESEKFELSGSNPKLPFKGKKKSMGPS